MINLIQLILDFLGLLLLAVEGWQFFGRDWLAEIASKREDTNNWQFVVYRKRTYDPFTNFFTSAFWPNDYDHDIKRDLPNAKECKKENTWFSILKFMMNIQK